MYNKQFDFSYEFYLLAPELDNYKYTLFTVLSNITPLYPVAIFENKNKSTSQFANKFTICVDEESLLTSLNSIIGSDSTTEIVRALYFKSIRAKNSI